MFRFFETGSYIIIKEADYHDYGHRNLRKCVIKLSSKVETAFLSGKLIIVVWHVFKLDQVIFHWDYLIYNVSKS